MKKYTEASVQAARNTQTLEISNNDDQRMKISNSQESTWTSGREIEAYQEERDSEEKKTETGKT